MDMHQKPLSVILAVGERASWQIRSEPGAWRRILLNLLGNALKYTKMGFIEVSLSYTDIVRAQPPGRQTMVTVAVKDTGCGIGKDYLQHHLYTPFAQENALAVGTGLGLSIVKQIASSLRGEIDIQSEVGIGTEVAVSIPIDLEPSPAESENSMRFGNLTLCLLGFDVYPDLDSAPTGMLSTPSKLAIALKTAIVTQAEQWFGLLVTSAQTSASIEADIIAVTEDNLNLLQFDADNSVYKLPLPPKSSLLVLCSDVLAETQSKWKHLDRVECLTQPFGPRKMAKALAACLKHQQSESNSLPGLQSKAMSKPAKFDQPLASSEITSSDRLPEKDSEFHLATTPGSSRVTGESAGDQLGTVTLPEILRKPYLLLVDDNGINLKVGNSQTTTNALTNISLDACHARTKDELRV